MTEETRTGKSFQMRLQGRQGNVLLIARPKMKIGKDAKEVKSENGRFVLSEGRVTGHGHYISDRGVKMYQTEAGTFLVVDENADPLCHEKHGWIGLPRGICIEVRQQQETTPWGKRLVQD